MKKNSQRILQKYKKPLSEYYEQLYANKFDNTEEMDNFLETYSLPKLDQEEIDQLKRLITGSEIEHVVKIFPANKSPEPGDFTDKSHQAYKDELVLILLKLFQKG